VIQVIPEPNLSLVDHVMRSPKVSVILATGGTPMVRAAYSSGNPAIGVGPGNAPALVDASADLDAAARRLVLSKSFDNSILCTNESVIVAEEAIADRLLQSLARAGAYVAKPDEVGELRDLLYGKGSFNTAILGKSAQEIGAKASIQVPHAAKIIVTPIDRVGTDEPLSREKLCPVIGFVRVPHALAGITTARALVRMSGAGHSAAIHSRNAANILAYGSQVRALRVVVNAPCSQGAAGFGTHLAPSFTIGTGFFGRSSIGENIEPRTVIDAHRLFGRGREAMGISRPGGLGARAIWRWTRRADVVGKAARGRRARGAECHRRRHGRNARRDPPHRHRGTATGAEEIGDGGTALLHLHRPDAASDAVLHGLLDARPAAQGRDGRPDHRGGARPRHRTVDRRCPQARRRRGRHPGGRAPVRLSRVSRPFNLIR
jgi:hypothetical protein